MFRPMLGAAGLSILAMAAGGTVALAHERSEQTVIQSRDFTIVKGQCSAIPPGLEIRGLGLERRQTIAEGVRDEGRAEDDEGVVSFSLSSRITGTATDNAGGHYRFVYQLAFKRPIVLPGSGVVTDSFNLTGTGQADGLSTFFRARVTLDSGGNPVGFELLEQSGDLHCDPL